MVKWLITKVIGTKNERDLKKLRPLAAAITELEPRIQTLSDAELRAKTTEFKEKLGQGASLDDILVEAFAVVREVGRRTVRMRHFDVQLIGGIVLHQGKIAEMKTGEGKTLVATLSAYLNALEGKGVHIVTVNDYLAKRDTEWMGPVFNFLGLSVGTIQHEMTDADRKHAYGCDVTYGTNNEFGFDYLRDNMKFRLSDLVQRKHHYAIVDEVDSILIDEARTPLIISGPTEESTALYFKVDNLVRRFHKEKHYKVDEKTRTVSILEDGVSEAEKFLSVSNLYDLAHMDLVHHINQSLKAHHLFKRDVDYMVQDGKVIIVDEFTGRLMPGRRYSDGLHQALEAKERVRVEEEYQTLASITFQNYFRMYHKLAGMTGTAATEATEFHHIYKLDVIEIPTNKDLIRHEHPDVVYRTADEKWEAALEEIIELNKMGRPVLVGTVSIEKSEHLSTLLRRKGLKHVVLNAKYHEMEATIIAQAGRVGAVTIATNMAGRGVDILLGGNPDFLAREQLRRSGVDPLKATQEQWEKALAEAKGTTEEEHQKVVGMGGLHIIGTERHEARRIDRQLRGRSGRQGDPGSSRFYLSLEDDLMRLFGSDRIASVMDRLGVEDGEVITHRMVTKSIERAQKRVEGHNFQIRKHLLEYDNVMNQQREVVYDRRGNALRGENLREEILTMINAFVEEKVNLHVTGKHVDDWDLESLQNVFQRMFLIGIPAEFQKSVTLQAEVIKDGLLKLARQSYENKERLLTPKLMRQIERFAILRVIDDRWRAHLYEMDQMKEGIGLRAYGQKDPLLEYKGEGFRMFKEMLGMIDEQALEFIFKAQVTMEPPQPVRRRAPAALTAVHQSTEGMGYIGAGQAPSAPAPPKPGKPQPIVLEQKVGRNDPCPCGSGKKYKKCHGVDMA